MMQIEHDCEKCKHGYFYDMDHSGWHALCGAGRCYHCHQSCGGECEDYEEGTPPDNEGREVFLATKINRKY